MEENEVNENKKLSYEQLESVARQLNEQNNHLLAKLQEIQMGNVFKRIDYLFKVLDNAHMFKDEFVRNCTNEIEEFMTIPEKPDVIEEDNK